MQAQYDAMHAEVSHLRLRFERPDGVIALLNREFSVFARAIIAEISCHLPKDLAVIATDYAAEIVIVRDDDRADKILCTRHPDYVEVMLLQRHCFNIFVNQVFNSNETTAYKEIASMALCVRHGVIPCINDIYAWYILYSGNCSGLQWRDHQYIYDWAQARSCGLAVFCRKN